MSKNIDIFNFRDLLDIISNDIFTKLSFRIVDVLPEESSLNKQDLGTIILKKENSKMSQYFIWKNDSNIKLYKLYSDEGSSGTGINIVEVNSIPSNIDSYSENTLLISKDNKMCIIYLIDGVKKKFIFNDGNISLISYEDLLNYYEEV